MVVLAIIDLRSDSLLALIWSIKRVPPGVAFHSEKSVAARREKSGKMGRTNTGYVL